MRPRHDPEAVLEAVAALHRPVLVVRGEEGSAGVLLADPGEAAATWAKSLIAVLPPTPPDRLGHPGFTALHGVAWPCVVGAMARGIASVPLVVAAARANTLAFLGTAGLGLEATDRAVTALAEELGGHDLPWGVNLIHTPGDPELEEALVGRYLQRGVRRGSASAFLGLTPGLVRFAASGMTTRGDGSVQRFRHLFAKVSRPEVARPLLEPPPAALLDALVARGHLTRAEADRAARLPVASHVTVEADSGGHTDSRPLTVILPAIRRLRDRLLGHRSPDELPFIGAAGGIGDPMGASAAFGAGADYILTGSINQAAVEAGTSDGARAMLAGAGLADFALAPAGDMFEAGARVQVLKRGTLFPGRANRLWEVFRRYPALEAIPDAERASLEADIFREPLERVWGRTRAWLEENDPREADRCASDPRARMAFTFRWYLGLSSRWAQAGDPGRQADFQIWSGPALGAFNDWVAGTPLAAPERRHLGDITSALMVGAARVTRANALRAAGVPVPAAAWTAQPGEPLETTR
jgi:trans-AT polyketide synthase, acyltransferase and oxidoreductase domains